MRYHFGSVVNTGDGSAPVQAAPAEIYRPGYLSKAKDEVYIAEEVEEDVVRPGFLDSSRAVSGKATSSGAPRPGYLSGWGRRDLSGFGQFGQGDRAGPNKAGGLPTRYNPTDLMFNPDEPEIIYNIPFMIGKPRDLPAEYIPKPGAVASWMWDPSKGPAPWPGVGADPRIKPVAPTPVSAPVSASGGTTISTGVAAPALTAPMMVSPDVSYPAYQPSSPVETPASSGPILAIGVLAIIGISVFAFLKKKKAPVTVVAAAPVAAAPAAATKRRKKRRNKR